LKTGAFNTEGGMVPEWTLHVERQLSYQNYISANPDGLALTYGYEA
jgi:hypothetical protein